MQNLICKLNIKLVHECKNYRGFDISKSKHLKHQVDFLYKHSQESTGAYSPLEGRGRRGGREVTKKDELVWSRTRRPVQESRSKGESQCGQEGSLEIGRIYERYLEDVCVCVAGGAYLNAYNIMFWQI